jgi:Family of unknown function (DUF6353)
MNVGNAVAKLSTAGGPKVQLALAKVSKYSPQILTGVGVVGGIVSTILIARATVHLEDLVEEHEMGKQIIEERVAENYYATKKAHTKAVVRNYRNTSINLIKLYGPGVSLGVASIVSVVAAQGIAQKRQVALVAAVKSAESAFSAYRARVIEAIGAEKEADIRYGISTESVEDENGKSTKQRVFDPDGLSSYVRYFEPGNPNFQRGNRELNLLFLKNIQSWCNDRLDARGYLYLNEVYGFLGLEPTPAGQVVGWLHADFKNGDGYVDFNVDNPVNDQRKRFLDGDDGGLLLDFNVDGEINSKL